MKVLNLYAGIGGNRKLWENVQVTAVEYDEEIASIYKDHFPDDEVIVSDAKKYLLEHHEDFDFVWSSPPCPTHSVTNNFLNAQGVKRYPDMGLYQQIIYLSQFHKGKYCVENVKSYYAPLIKPQELDRHYFWANFKLRGGRKRKNSFNTLNAASSTRKKSDEYIESLIELYGFDLRDKGVSKSKMIKYMRNCVHPETGLYILNAARNIITRPKTKQAGLFENESANAGQAL